MKTVKEVMKEGLERGLFERRGRLIGRFVSWREGTEEEEERGKAKVQGRNDVGAPIQLLGAKLLLPGEGSTHAQDTGPLPGGWEDVLKNKDMNLKIKNKKGPSYQHSRVLDPALVVRWV